ncbi:MAG TPA: antitoxin Xre/MbcA/ParS toxin-binding domain-containing protein [Galbitalea sp.]|jgi:uncharacterized protein (DUF2384 family)
MTDIAWENVHPVPLTAMDSFRNLLDRVTTLPAFAAFVSEEYKAGYSASREDILPTVDVEVTELLGVYEVLEVARSIFEPKALGAFLSSPVDALGGKSPIDLMSEGSPRRVLELLASEVEGQIR